MDAEPICGASSYLFDSENVAEIVRLINMDNMVTRAMEGPLAEQPVLAKDQCVLDIACGPGGWVLELAYAYPDVEVAGIDNSHAMIRFANARAQSQGLCNASFEVMDVRQPLTFSDQSFDLINGRFLVDSLLQTSWSQLIKEGFRLLRPGGVLRLTEADNVSVTNSGACERLNALFMQFAHQSGYGFSVDGRTFGITAMLEPLLHQAGFQDIHSRGHGLSFPAGSQMWSNYHENALVAYLQIGSLLTNAGLLTKDEEERLMQQAREDLYSEAFAGTSFCLTVWGRKPE